MTDLDLEKYTPEIIKRLFDGAKKPVRFTAKDIREIMVKAYHFTEEELIEIMDREVEKPHSVMDTDLVDACAEAILLLREKDI